MIALSSLLWAGCAWLWVAPRVDQRLLPATDHGSSVRGSPWSSPGGRRAATIAAAVAVFALLGVPLGPVAAIGVLVIMPRWLATLEPAAKRRRREELTRQGPLVADLLAATLASGAGVQVAVGAVADAMGEPAGTALRPVVLALDLGADPVHAWALADDEGAFEPIVSAVLRAHRSGAPLADLLSAIAEDLRRDTRRAVDVAARSAGVRAVAPLAVCFLPAFLLLGVVPVVVSLASTVTGGSVGG